MAFETFWTGRWAIFWKTTFSHNTEGKIYNDIPRFSGVELHVCKCLKTFLSLDTFYSFFFFNLSFTFYLVAGNILSLLSNVNPQNSSASVFTRVYTHERGYREQRILVVRHKITVYRNRSFGKKSACFGQCFQFSPPRAKLSGQWTCAGTVPCPGHQQLGSF